MKRIFFILLITAFAVNAIYQTIEIRKLKNQIGDADVSVDVSSIKDNVDEINEKIKYVSDKIDKIESDVEHIETK